MRRPRFVSPLLAALAPVLAAAETPFAVPRADSAATDPAGALVLVGMAMLIGWLAFHRIANRRR